jgi:hypothetical protein
VLPVPTVADLAAFSDREEASLSGYASISLTQATLLFSIVTKLTEMPTDADQAMLATNAILEMAERIYLEKPYSASRASPYHSETIGSYSYSKGSTAALARLGQTTGLFWWDLAIDELSLPGTTDIDTSSIAVFERHDIYLDSEGDRFVVGPSELVESDSPYDVNAELNPRLR